MALLSLPEYIATQSTERYRAFILHGPAMSGKTRLAQWIRDALGAHLLDLQTYFIAHPDLCARLDRYRPLDLEQMLLALDVPQSLVVVDNLDFLLNAWTPRYRQEFVAMVGQRIQSPTLTKKTFVLIVQTDSTLLRSHLTNTPGQSRILPIDAFYAVDSTR